MSDIWTYVTILGQPMYDRRDAPDGGANVNLICALSHDAGVVVGMVVARTKT